MMMIIIYSHHHPLIVICAKCHILYPIGSTISHSIHILSTLKMGLSLLVSLLIINNFAQIYLYTRILYLYTRLIY